MEEAYRSTMRDQLKTSKITLMPVHGRAHWCLVGVTKDAVHVLDSMGRTGTESGLLDAMRWLCPELPSRVERPDVAQQSDAVSCGIFTIAFADAIVESSNQAFWTLPQSIDAWGVRRRLLDEASAGKT